MKTIRANIQTIEALVDCEIITLVDDECNPIPVNVAHEQLTRDEPVTVTALAMSGLRLSVDVELGLGWEEWVLVPLNPIE